MTAVVTIKTGDASVMVTISGSSTSKSENGKIKNSSSSYSTHFLDPNEELVASVFKGQTVSVRAASDYEVKMVKGSKITPSDVDDVDEILEFEDLGRTES